jgi:hypothetical protein
VEAYSRGSTGAHVVYRPRKHGNSTSAPSFALFFFALFCALGPRREAGWVGAQRATRQRAFLGSALDTDP